MSACEGHWPVLTIGQQLYLDRGEDASVEQTLIAPVQRSTPDSGDNESPFGIDSNKFSSLTRLLRVTALVLRFIMKLQKQGNNEFVTGEEIRKAELLWLQHLQKKHFKDEFAIKNSSLQRQLGIYILLLDASGLLRCRGRLENAC